MNSANSACAITFRQAKDLTRAAELTLANMRSYYEEFSVHWDSAHIEKMCMELSNFEILSDSVPVGILRLSFDNEACHVRDLQVSPLHQNKGIGSRALAEAERLAKESNLRLLKLKVFKHSPAVQLYKRHGFIVKNADERFNYMERAISGPIAAES